MEQRNTLASVLAAPTLFSFSVSHIFVSWCVHVLQFCLFYCILKSLIIIPTIDYILIVSPVINAFAFDLCNENSQMSIDLYK